MAISPYTGKMLRVDLLSGRSNEVPTSAYADRFLGGTGIAAKIYWDEVSPQVSALDPRNLLMFLTGPLACYPVIGASRWVVCGKSPATTPEHFVHSNLGGHWGAELKLAGYDGLIVQGQAEKPVYLFVRDNGVEIRDAAPLWGKGAVQAREMLKAELGQRVKVVTIGPAGENQVVLATLLADNDASGSGGLGAVMGSKRLKAVAVQGTKRAMPVANPQRFQTLLNRFRILRRGNPVGDEALLGGPRTKKDVCYGCIGNCPRRAYTAENGTRGKWCCQSGRFYIDRAEQYYGKPNEVPFFATRLSDQYGIDTDTLSVMMLWLWRCYRAGILSDENTGLPISKSGSQEFIEALLKKVALREGFGDILARGVFAAAAQLGPKAQAELTDYYVTYGQRSEFNPRLYITTSLLFVMEPRRPIPQLHEISNLIAKWTQWVNNKPDAFVSTEVIRGIARKFWGSEAAMDFSTYEGKALAARKIQDRQYTKECLILCDFLWPITDVEFAEDHVGDPTFESQVYSAITGQEIDEVGLNCFGERVFNLRRAIMVREGHKGRQSDSLPESWFTMPLRHHPTQPQCLVPGRSGEVICRKGEVVDRNKFETLKDEYYSLRGWDPATGLQTRVGLDALGLGEVADVLSRGGLAK